MSTLRTKRPSAANHKPNSSDSAEVFAAECRQTLAKLRESIRRIVSAVPASGARPTDLARAFDLDYALAWQVHSLAHQPEASLTSRIVPKRGAMERFLRSAARTAPDALARDADAAYQAFEQVVEELAGDRDTFDAMLTLQRPSDRAGLQKLRRAAHRANAAVWGVSCRCAIRALVFHERPSGEQDGLMISGRIGLQRLYAEARVSIVASARLWGSFLKSGHDPAVVIAPCELIESACTTPLPRLDKHSDSDGTHRDFLTVDGLGKRGESTFFWRNVSLHVPELSRPPHGLSAMCMVPTELVLLDLVIPRAWLENPSTRGWLSPDTTRLTIPDPAGQYRLPFEGDAQRLGNSLSNLHTRAAPQYADLVQAEIARMGWSDSEFEIFRLEVQFPVLHSAAHLCVE